MRPAARRLSRWKSGDCSSAGALDTTFGSGGTIKSEISIYKLVALPNKQILVGTGADQPTLDGSYIQRLNENGTQDLSFGNTEATDNGFPKIAARTPSGGSEPLFFVDMAAAPNNKVAVLGYSSGSNWAVALLDANGQLDPSFGGNGLATVDTGFADSQPVAVAVQSDGKILAVGSPAGRSFRVVRFNTNGTLDTSFDGDGIDNYYLDHIGSVTSIALTADNKLVVAGMTRATASAPATRTLVRFWLTNGSRDNSFGTGGVVVDSGTEKLVSTAVDSSGRVYTLASTSANVLVNRYNPNGTPDLSYGHNGQASFANDGMYLVKIAIEADGKALVSGETTDPNPNSSVGTARNEIIRLNTNGTLDNTFGVGGRVNQSVGILGNHGGTMAITVDNKVVSDPGEVYISRFLLSESTGDSSSASIAGTVFNDANKNGSFDGGDVTLASRVVYIDANNNGKLDAGEKAPPPTASGITPSMVFAAGTYIIRRADTPAGYTYSEPVGGAWTVTLNDRSGRHRQRHRRLPRQRWWQQHGLDLRHRLQ